jgi:hypothetical protein
MENTQDIKTNADIKPIVEKKRICKKCDNIYSITEFPENRNKNNITYSHTCVECTKATKKTKNKIYYQKKKERGKEAK